MGEARRFAAAVLRDASLDEELIDLATLLVSEVVTNAVLHASTPIELRCAAAAQWVRVEVADRSPVTPAVRHYDVEAATGRGLAMVEMLAADWGVEPRLLGKAVWFALGDAPAIPYASHEAAGPAAGMRVRFRRLPVRLVHATIQYGESVLRELALFSFDESSMAASLWSAPRLDLSPLLAPLDAALAAEADVVDLDVTFPGDAGSAALARMAMVDEADRMAQRGETLTLPPVPEIAYCRHWLYGQVALQAEGAPPVPWELPPPLEPTLDAASLSEEECAQLDGTQQAIVVADDGNRIVFVNVEAARLLGWSPRDLIGRRLLTIIPPEWREAHLAGFARYQLTGETRVIGGPVELSALRQDGTTLPVRLTITVDTSSGGRRLYRAMLDDRPR